ncbi:hypothetical protein F4780DRAFT_536620 [Xylariomycetidae sp. FL0641]|nr:hypothetical protein F4780DRAFT_536620 [Xylariomycetidae sp. FL0641]
MEAQLKQAQEESSKWQRRAKMAEDHLFNLATPGRRETTTSEIGDQYLRNRSDVQNFVWRWSDPMFEANVSDVIQRVKQDETSLIPFKKQLARQLDLGRAIFFDGTEVDVLEAAILGFLVENVYMAPLADRAKHSKSHVNSVVSQLENSMKAYKDNDKSDRDRRRTWRATCLYAWTQHPHYPACRREFAEKLTASFLRLFGFLALLSHKTPSSDDFVESVRKEIIEPSLALQEAVQTTSFEHRWERSTQDKAEMPAFATEAEMRAFVKKHQCKDLSMRGKRLSADKLNVSGEELRKRLRLVCSVVPEMKASEPGGYPEKTATIFPETVLVDWQGQGRHRPAKNWLFDLFFGASVAQ